MTEVTLPRGAVKLAAEALIRAGLLDNAGYIKGDEAGRVALTAAWPVIEKAILRDAAKRILLLPGLSSGSRCPQCHALYATGPDLPNPRFYSDRMRCRKGHEWDRPPVPMRPGGKVTTDSLLQSLTRGEPLPDLPPREAA